MAADDRAPYLPLPDESDRDFESLIVELSSRFILLPPEEIDSAIENALGEVCERLGIDFAVLWQWSRDDPRLIVPTHVHLHPEMPSTAEPRAQNDYPWVVERIRTGRLVVVESLDDLPPEADVDRESARQTGIHSNLTVPLRVGGAPPIGALAFNTVRQRRAWPEALVQRLQLVAEIFTNAVARKRRELDLMESEERLSLAAEAAGVGIWSFDYATGVFWATARARELFGFAPDELITLAQLEGRVHPDDWTRVRRAIEATGPSGDRIDEQYRILLPDAGGERWISSRGRAQLAPGREPMRLLGVSTDITAVRRAEEAVLASEARLSAGADLAQLGYYEVDFGRKTASVDGRFTALFGLPPDQREGLAPLEFWLEHLHPEDRARVLEERRQLHDGEVEAIATEYRFRPPAGEELWIEHIGRVSQRDAEGRPAVTFGVLRDITALKRSEAELHDLSRRLIRAHEEERALLARELHDDVTQRLALLAIDLGRAELAQPDSTLAPILAQARDALARLSEDVHSLAYQLHPSVLAELGLPEALRTECERLRRRQVLDVSADLDPASVPVGRDAELCLFRVAQEALNNAVRHARARSVTVTLRRHDGGLLLAVSDDGVGFDATNPTTGRSLGLASMRERVRLANGTIDLESEPGHGTSVIAWVPAL